MMAAVYNFLERIGSYLKKEKEPEYKPRFFRQENIQLTSIGWTTFKLAERQLREELGEEGYIKLENRVKELANMSERDLVRLASFEWVIQHPEHAEIVSRWMTPIKSD
jgi:hypothetical protein